jgi:putative oxidoreductase
MDDIMNSREIQSPAQSFAQRASSSSGSTAALVGRTLLSAIFLISGLGKLAAPAATIGYIASAGIPFPQIGLAIAIGTELLGGLALVAGFHTRAVAGLLGVFCLATALLFHTHFGDQNQFIHFFKNIAMAGGMLQVVAFGGGRFSLDARRP